MGKTQEARTADREFQPGEMIPGKGIFIGEFALVDGRGNSLGIRTKWYDTAIEIGKPKTFTPARF